MQQQDVRSPDHRTRSSVRVTALSLRSRPDSTSRLSATSSCSVEA
ncbi:MULTISPECIES: hypothetical protein [unclassified Streptomyces]|nr:MULTISPECIES: hypothetical protein [unclassified Streptomyces]